MFIVFLAKVTNTMKQKKPVYIVSQLAAKKARKMFGPGSLGLSRSSGTGIVSKFSTLCSSKQIELT